MAERREGLVCDKCLETSPTKKQLLSIECFNSKEHKQKRRLVRVQWSGTLSRLVEISRRKSTVSKAKPKTGNIRPMPDVSDLKGRFILCDRARCKGERCTHPHSVEERDAWNEELLGDQGSAIARRKRIGVEFKNLLKKSPNNEIPLRSFQQTYQTFYHKSFRVSDFISDTAAGVRELVSQCDGIQVRVKTIKGKKDSYVCLSTSLAEMGEAESQGTSTEEEDPNLQVKGNEPEWPSLGTTSSQQGSKGSVSAWDKPLQSKIGTKIVTNKADVPTTKRKSDSKVTVTANRMQPQRDIRSRSTSKDVQSLPKQEEFPTLPAAKPSTTMSQMNAAYGQVATASQELNTSDPIEFQFLETKEESSYESHDFMFQSQPVGDLNPYSHQHGLNVHENLKADQAAASQPNPITGLQYSMFDDPCIIGHSQVNDSTTNSQPFAMITTPYGAPVVQNEEATIWPDFESMSTGMSIQESPRPTHQLNVSHVGGLLPTPITVDAYSPSATVGTSAMPVIPAAMSTSQNEQAHLPVQTKVPLSNVIKPHEQGLSQSNYKDLLKSCLTKEKAVHKTELAKCDGEYTMCLHKQGYRPRWMYDYESDQFGYIKGVKGGHISYCAQASQCVVISKLDPSHREVFRAQIPRSNLFNFDEVLYIALDSNNSRAAMNSLPHVTRPQQVYVNFMLKDSYFHTLRQSVDSLPIEIIQRILPDANHFYAHPVSNEVDLGEYERYCNPDHGQISALKTIVSCPDSGPPVLIIGPFGAGKSRILAVAALYFMKARHDSPSRVLVCMHQRASVESFIASFSSLIASKEGMGIYVVQNYGKPKNESLKKWYVTVDDFKQSYQNGLKYPKPFLVITTCMTSRNLCFLPRDFFTHIMLDEAAQQREPENITPLCLATPNTKIVVAGDPNQVGPATLVLGDKTQLSTSLLERLLSTYVQLGSLANRHLVTLMNNYRCHESILQLVGELYYDFPLMWAGHQPAPPLHPDAPYPLIFVCSSVEENDYGTSTLNKREAEIVLEELVDKANRWPPAWRNVDLSQFCVMSPNRSQMSLLQQVMREKKLTNQLKSLALLTTAEIQGREYRGVFLSTSEPIEEDGSSTDHRKSLADRYVFNTAITRAQSLVVSVGNPFLLLGLEQHMLQRYGEKGKCWSSYLKLCMENGTLKFDKFLGLTPDSEASCISKIQALVEEQYRIATEMVEKESSERKPLHVQEAHSAQIPMEFSPQPLESAQQLSQPQNVQQPTQPQILPQSTFSQLHQQSDLEYQQVQQNYSSQSFLPPVSAYWQQQYTTNVAHGLQPSQPMIHPSSPPLHGTNSGLQVIQASHSVLYPNVVDHQPHSIYVQTQSHQQLAQAPLQTNYYSNSPIGNTVNTPIGQHHPTMANFGEPNLSPALNPFGLQHVDLLSMPVSQFSPTSLPDANKSPEQKEVVSQATSQAHMISPTTSTTSTPCRIHICNITERYDEITIRLYFESASSGGGKVENIEMLGNGAAIITFMNPEVIETVLQNSHFLFGPNATVTKHSTVTSSDLVPPGSQQPQEQCDDSTIIQDQTAVEPVASCSSIRLSNVTQHYNSDYIELYFEQLAHNNGVNVEMKGNGDAIIHFDKPEDTERALQGRLDKFGEKATVERILPDQDQDVKAETPDGQIEVSIQQLKAECLAKDPSGLHDHLSSLHVQVTVDAGQGKVMITPTNLTKAGWQKEAKEMLETYAKSKLLARTKKTQLANSEEGIAELKDFVDQLKQKGCFAYEFKKENAQLRIAGDDDSVKQCESKLKEIVEGFKVIEEDVPLSRERYDILKLIKLSEIKSKFPEVNVTDNPKTPSLKLKGLRRAVQKFRNTIVEDDVHKTLPVHVDDQVTRYFQTKRGKFLLKEVLKDSVCRVGHHFLTCDQTSSTTLNLFCDPSQESAASRVVESLKQATDMNRIRLPESLVEIWEEVAEKYTALCDSFEERYSVVVKRSEEDTSIAGKKEDVTQCNFELTSFIEQKCTLTEDIRLERGDWRLLKEHLNEKWADITTQCQQQKVQLQAPKMSKSSKASSNLHVTLIGDRIAVKMIYDTVTGLLQSICREVIPVDRPGTMKYFHSRGASGVLKTIETERKVAIEVVDPNKVIEDDVIEKAIPITCQHTQKYLAPLDDGKQIIIVVGDITKFTQADVLVNAANVDLDHIGGVAKAISDKGGPIIQNESRLYVKQNGRLQTGEAWLTSKAGGLPCKALVHAVGPIWKGGKKNEEAMLVNACINTLKAVSDNGYSSVAFPAISAGIYSYPLDKCARVMVRSLIMFYKDFPKSSIQDCYIILLKNEDALPFIATLKQFLPANAEKDEPPPEHPVPSCNSEPSKPKTAWSLPPATEKEDHVPKYYSAWPAPSRHDEVVSKPTEDMSPTCSYQQPIPQLFESKPQEARPHPAAYTNQTKSNSFYDIKLHRGSIVDVKADVYVNTTNRDLDLSNGAVSKALLEKGGERLQLECTQKAPIKYYGDIVTTGSGNLQCQYVLHTVLPKHDSKSAETVLRSIVSKCMRKCSQLGMQSIAFPAIGTGILGYPEDFVAKIMVQKISQCLNFPSNILVHLVIYTERTYIAFRRELQSLKRSFKQQQLPQAEALTSPNVSARKTLLSSDTPRGQQVYRKTAYMPTATKASTHYVLTTPLPAPSLDSPSVVQPTDKQTTTYLVGSQNLVVTIVSGDITEETSDVIVNCTNSKSKLGMQGVAGAMQRKGGPQLQQLFDKEMENRGHCLGGARIIETQATGSLKCKSIFHVHFSGQTPRGFQNLIVACLQRAQANAFSTISFPAIGTGGGGYPPEAAASGMLKAIEEFSHHCSLVPQHCFVKRIRIVLFSNPLLYVAFITAFKSSRVSTTHKLPSPSEPLASPSSESETNVSDSEDEIATGPESLEDTPTTNDSSDEEEIDDEVEKLEIKIYGESEDIVKASQKEVQDMIDENLIEDNVEITIAEKLPRAERRGLIQEGKKHNVRIVIDEDSQQSIQLSGCKDDVAKVKVHIVQALTSLKEKISKEQAAEHLYQTIRWRKEDSSEYDQDTNYAIEMAYRTTHETQPKFSHGSYDTPLYFTIDFVQMEETDHHANDSCVKVSRINLEMEEHLKKDQLPPHWSPMPIDPTTGSEKTLHCVTLVPNSDEYNDVKSEFDKTMTTYGSGLYTRSYNSYGSIVRIERIQNPVLYAPYAMKKKAMEQHNTAGSQIEHRLFHGTSGDTCATINRSGFNRSYAGKHATVYGRGVYFARDASYSARDQYSLPDRRGQKFIYLARVLTGEYTVGNHAMLEPPLKNRWDESSSRYDSVVDRTDNPNIFVIFNDTSMYPEYLIVFTLLY